MKPPYDIVLFSQKNNPLSMKKNPENSKSLMHVLIWFNYYVPVYITSSYYASQYITDANWYNTITADAVIVVLSMILSAVIMFGNFGQIANENLTASKIYHNIYLNLQNEIVKYLPNLSQFDKAQRLSSCAILSNNELQWVEFICPSVMILGKEPTEEELKMEVQNMEIIRELEDIRNRSFRSQIVPIQSVLPPAPQTPLPSILLHGHL